MPSAEFQPDIEARLAQMGPGTRVLVTGGAGYFGAVLCEMLIERGFHVTVVDNLAFGQSTLFNLFHSGRLEFVFGDVTNEAFMAKLLEGRRFDYICPLAAIVGFPVSEQKPEYTWMLNHGAVLTLLKHRKPGSRILFPTTNSGYGTTTGEVHCTEESPLNPISAYGKSKVAAEKEIAKSKDYVCFRLATLFGFAPRMRTDLLVNHFTLKALSDKTLVLFEKDFKRNFLHVRDAARGFLWAMANWEAVKDNVYNLGHPDYNISKDELCALIKKEVPDLNVFYAPLGKDPDKRNYVVSNDKILKTGFTFKYPLEAGIKELVAGYSAFKDFRFKNY